MKFSSFRAFPFLTLLLVGFALSGSVFSQQDSDSSPAVPLSEVIVPLVDANTIVVVHFDLDKIDFELILEKLIVSFEENVKEKAQGRTIDPLRMTQTRTALQESFNYYFRDFREIRGRLIEEAGIRDLFMVVYSDTSEQVPFVLAVPQKGKTAEQRKAFARIIRGAFPIMFSEHGFMIGSAPFQAVNLKESTAAIKEKLKNLEPVPANFLKPAFRENAGAGITIVGIIPPGLSKTVARHVDGGRFPKVLVQLTMFITERVRWVSLGVDFEKSSLNLVAQTGSGEQASDILKAISQASQKAIDDLAVLAAEQDSALVPQERRTQVVELVRQALDEFKPTIRNRDQLHLLLDQKKPAAMGRILNPLLTAYINTQQATWMNQCMNNFNALRAAIEKYVEDKGEYPPAWSVDAEGIPLHSWRVHLLPYLDEEDLFNSIRLNESWDSEHNRQFHAKMPLIFRCPACIKATGSTTTYAYVVGSETFPPGPKSLKPSDITDDPGKTVMLVETKTPFCWMKPEDIPQEVAFEGVGVERGIGSNHVLGTGQIRGANLQFFSEETPTQFIRNNAPLENLRAILTFSGGEDIELK